MAVTMHHLPVCQHSHIHDDKGDRNFPSAELNLSGAIEAASIIHSHDWRPSRAIVQMEPIDSERGRQTRAVMIKRTTVQHRKHVGAIFFDASSWSLRSNCASVADQDIIPREVIGRVDFETRP